MAREHWRVVRARNKWQPAEDCARHPVPGTYPVVMTGEADWGGWRVPGAEYDLDPGKIEEQARLIANAPQLAVLRQRRWWTGRASPARTCPTNWSNWRTRPRTCWPHVKGRRPDGSVSRADIGRLPPAARNT